MASIQKGPSFQYVTRFWKCEGRHSYSMAGLATTDNTHHRIVAKLNFKVANFFPCINKSAQPTRPSQKQRCSLRIKQRELRIVIDFFHNLTFAPSKLAFEKRYGSVKFLFRGLVTFVVVTIVFIFRQVLEFRWHGNRYFRNKYMKCDNIQI